MADLDLATALQMFNDSTNKLMLTRALNSANDQVNQIKASELSDQEKRAQLQGLSNNLVMHMASLGTPATTMQLVQGAIGPKQFGSANDMMREGILTGNQDLQNEATQFQPFENNEKMELAKIKAMRNADPLRQAQFESLQDERFTKHSTDLNNKIDPNTSRFGNIAKLQGVNNQIATMAPMLNDPTQWTPTAMNETIRKLDSVLSQGTATVAGTKELTPKINAMYQAELKQLYSNKPEPMAGAQAWQQYYKDVFGRIASINDKVMKESQLNYVQGEIPALMKQFPGRVHDIEQSLSNKIGEPVVIDPVTKAADLQSNVEKQDMYAQAISKAAANPGDVRIKQVLDVIGQDDRNLRRVFLRYPELRKVYSQLNTLHK